MALLEERGHGARSVTTPRGEVRAYALTPRVYVTVATGHLEAPGAQLIVDYGNDRIRAATGKLYVFHDWLDMTGYESSCRQQLTAWTAETRGSLAELHIAFRSKLVAMGVQVANLALGGLIRMHEDRSSLERELRRAVRIE